AGGDHGAQHLPVGGAEVLSLVDDDVPVAVTQVAHRGAVVVKVGQVATADVSLAFGPELDLAGAFHLVAGRPLGGLRPGFTAQSVQAQGELVEQLPNDSAFGTAEGAPHTGAAGLEVVLAGGK